MKQHSILFWIWNVIYWSSVTEGIAGMIITPPSSIGLIAWVIIFTFGIILSFVQWYIAYRILKWIYDYVMKLIGATP